MPVPSILQTTTMGSGKLPFAPNSTRESEMFRFKEYSSLHRVPNGARCSQSGPVVHDNVLYYSTWIGYGID
jgi:hypothetical protein